MKVQRLSLTAVTQVENEHQGRSLPIMNGERTNQTGFDSHAHAIVWSRARRVFAMLAVRYIYR